ncbi:hypothetical protein AC781_01130 [Akkermansia glycaniphila]|nr:hypothetical protein AC781_01130 [Akkermansia glycaniphila]
MDEIFFYTNGFFPGCQTEKKGQGACVDSAFCFQQQFGMLFDDKTTMLLYRAYMMNARMRQWACPRRRGEPGWRQGQL